MDDYERSDLLRIAIADAIGQLELLEDAPPLILGAIARMRQALIDDGARGERDAERGAS